MINPEIISYIRSEREKQTPDATIRSNLLTNGWSEADISEAFTAITNAGTPMAHVSVPPTMQASAPGTTPLVSQITAQSTPPTAGATPAQSKVADKKALKKYRFERMWIYFGSMVFLGVAYIGLVALTSSGVGGLFSGLSLMIIVVYGLLILAAAYVASRAAVPYGSTWRNVADLILGLVATFVLSFVFGFIAAYVFCLIIASTGGLSGL